MARKAETMAKKIIGIWAQDENGLIGKEDHLPWSFPADLQHFKETTTGHAMVMGRVTFDGMGRRALPNRTSIVLTRDSKYTVESDRVLVLHSVEEVLDWYAGQDKSLFVIGGGQVFTAFEPYLEELVRTDIQGVFEGDAYFPESFDWSCWQEKSAVLREKDEVNPVDFVIRTFEKKEN